MSPKRAILIAAFVGLLAAPALATVDEPALDPRVLRVDKHVDRSIGVPKWDPASPQRLVRIDATLYQEDAGLYFAVIPGRITVRLAEGIADWNELVAQATAARPTAFASLSDLELVRSNHLGVVRLTIPEGTDQAEWCALIHRTGLARYAEVSTHGLFQAVPNDPRYPDQWSLNNTGQDTGVPSADVDAEQAWDIATGDPSIVVAVLDSGTDIDHEDLAANVWHNDDEIPNNSLDDDNNGYVDDWEGWDFHNANNEPRPIHYHGTHVTGIINAVGGNGIGIAGLAGGIGSPGVLGMALGVGDEVENGDVIDEAVLYAADNGAQVITFALSTGETQAINDALDYAYSVKDVFIDSAAGNGGSEVSFPARHPTVMAVAATESDDTGAGFSNPGPEVEVAAPGTNIWSTRPNDGYATGSGTSFAAPHVAALAALIRGRNPNLTAADVRTLIIETAEDVENPGFDIKTGHGRINAFQGVTLASTSDGVVFFAEDEYTCDDTIELVVVDIDLAGAETVTVTISSDLEPGGETVVLDETKGGSGMFRGSIPSSFDAALPDGTIQVADGDTLVVEYVDFDDGQGGAGVLESDTATVDCVAPSIAGVGAEQISDVAATIVWTTDTNSDSRVSYGETVPPIVPVYDGDRVIAHAVDLDGLSECTVYYYSASSTDPAGNLALDDNDGAYFHFETLADFGQGPQPCHQGRVSIAVGEIGCWSSFPVSVGDSDLNTDPGLVETVTVAVSSTTEPGIESLVLTETGPDSSTFEGTIPTAVGSVLQGDDVLQVAHGDLLTVTYQDADDGSGNPATTFETAVVDCVGPDHVAISVTDISDHDATIAWTASQPVTGYVEWGTSPALGNQVSSSSSGVSHSVTIGEFAKCERIHFRVGSTDTAGNTSVADVGGVPFQFDGFSLQGIVYEDRFESSAGWTLDGEWEIDVPQGLGTSPGDPTSARHGSQVLGHDLSGLGSTPGDYELFTFQTATSPSIDLTGSSGIELRLDRWLNVDASGTAFIQAKDTNGVWRHVWSDSDLTESAWSEQVFDVTAHAAGNPAFQVRIEQNARFARAAGWNVDRLILRDTSVQTYGACGGCAGSPTFSGALSAVDDDPCADSGVTVKWAAAPAWGTGESGTYSVYRDTTTGFTPGPATLVASGVTGTSWTDSAAAADQTLYYVVLAENDESCGTGPNNSGTMDSNTVYVNATNETAQPDPGDVGNTLRADPVNGAHVRLTWAPATGAAAYHVYREVSPGGAFVRIAEPGDPLHEDPGTLGDGQDWYYSVVTTDACGNESAD